MADPKDDEKAKADTEAAARAAEETKAAQKKAAAEERARAEQEAIEAKTLVAMAKNGATLRVHPTCVNAHIAAGWVVSA